MFKHVSIHGRSLASCALCLSLTMVVLGCDGSKYAPVSGTVTLQGKPLAGAFIVFEPVVGSPDQIFKAETDDVGHFVLHDASGRTGCLVGEHHVRITTVPPGAMQDERSPLPKDRVPARYQRNPPTFDVPESGTDTADFDLTKG